MDQSLSEQDLSLIPDAHRKSRRRYSALSHGWRGTIAWAIVFTAVVLLFNAVLLIWSITRSVQGNVDIYSGDCHRSSTVYTIWHVVINALSTLLLAASNACMQVLASPTRSQIDSAHAKNKWLDIGVFSIRNLRTVGRKRVILIALLALSSAPLHFFYNSAVVHRLSSWEYMIAGVHQNFLEGDQASKGICLSEYDWDMDAYLNATQPKAMSGQLENLGWRDCITRLESGFTPDVRAVFLVSSTSNATHPVQGCESTLTGVMGSGSAGLLTLGDWMCSIKDNLTATCDFSAIKANQTWTIPSFPEQTPWLASEFTVDHCLLAEADQHCSVSSNVPLMAIVIVCNIIKLACFVYTLFFIGSFEPLVTLGDASVSFLQREDTRTVQLGPLGWQEIQAGNKKSGVNADFLQRLVQGRRFSAVSLPRWLSTVMLCVSLLIISTVLLFWYTGPNYIARWNWDFLARTTSGNWADISGDAAYDDVNVAGGAALVNLPQFLISAAYLFYNNLFTSIYVSVEYCRFATKTNTFRVSSPVGQQRSTYWLQLPYRYSLPFMFIMFVLHWMTSESLFLVYIDIYDAMDFKRTTARQIITAGWNPSAMSCCIALGTAMTLFLLVTGLRPIPKGMPVIGSCSLAIASACHRHVGEGPEIVEQKLRYGTFPNHTQEDWVGFTSHVDNVEPLVDISHRPGGQRPRRRGYESLEPAHELVQIDTVYKQ